MGSLKNRVKILEQHEVSNIPPLPAHLFFLPIKDEKPEQYATVQKDIADAKALGLPCVVFTTVDARVNR